MGILIAQPTVSNAFEGNETRKRIHADKSLAASSVPRTHRSHRTGTARTGTSRR